MGIVLFVYYKQHYASFLIQLDISWHIYTSHASVNEEPAIDCGG